MITLKCKNCGGEMSVDHHGSLCCEYCGRKGQFSDRELEGYRTFRKEFLNYLRRLNDEKTDPEVYYDGIWNASDTIGFVTASGEDIRVRYIYEAEDDIAKMYVARENVIFVFDAEHASYANKMVQNVQNLEYPAADVKNLRSCFPIISGSWELQDGGVLVAIQRKESAFPLAVFGALEPVHAAWIVSRMENICCVLEYNEVHHGALSVDSMFVDPFTHEGMLLGGWWNAGPKTGRFFEGSDLKDLRRVARTIMGVRAVSAPKEFLSFLEERPKADAYTDFEAWDRVIEKGFGGKRFMKMDAKGNLLV